MNDEIGDLQRDIKFWLGLSFNYVVTLVFSIGMCLSNDQLNRYI
jgi:hypothetical protein